MTFEPLCIGIKRAEFRANDANAKQADSAFEALRETALKKSAYRCLRCGYESTEDKLRRKHSVLHVHHQDNDHHNNEPQNHVPHCSLDHAYHHIGCDAPTPGGAKGWASQMRIAFAPELSPEDLNHVQRAIGAALSDAKEREIATEILDLLSVLSLPVRDVFGTNKAKEFAACFSSMSDVEYQERVERADGLRVLFHPDILKLSGSEMLSDAPLFPVKSWVGVANGFGNS